MQFFQTDHREQRRNDGNKEGKNGVADQNYSDALRVADIANGTDNRFEVALQRKSRALRFPRCNTYQHRKQTKGVERENGIGSDENQKQSSQSWTDNPRDVQL